MTTCTVQEAHELATKHHQEGRLADAEAIYRQILAFDPQHAEAMHHLGLIAHQMGKNDVAEKLIRASLSLDNNNAQVHGNFGKILLEMGHIDESIVACLHSISIQPEQYVGYFNLGNSYYAKRQLPEAADAYRQAINALPQFLDAYVNFSAVLIDQSCSSETIELCEIGLRFFPDNHKLHYNTGVAHGLNCAFDAAVASYRQALKCNPDDSNSCVNLGSALKEVGLMDEAIAVWRRIDISDALAYHSYSNLIYTLHFHPDYDAKRIAEEHRLWNQQFAEPLKKRIVPHTNDRDPERRLRVGYISPNFWAQAESYFVVPLLEGHDQSRYEIHAYAKVAKPDQVTHRQRRSVSVWHDVSGMRDDVLAEKIRQDGIDILVDLTMHMANTDLLVFARKPAPVQVTWLAYPGSTGLETMDYRITDSWMDPIENGTEGYSEESIRLPESWCCYDSMSFLPCVPVVPPHRGEFIRFGSFNNFCKLNDPLLNIWAQLLAKVPDSRLMLLAPHGEARSRILDIFHRYGVDGARIEFEGHCGREEYLRRFDLIDIAIDPLPYNGITTTLDALWMGVPVVSLTGNTAAGRAGLSLLSTLGHPELVATNAEQFIEIAAGLATDIPRLTELRANLRQEMQKSPLMDGVAFARHMEAAYRDVWRTWCATPES